MMRLAREKQADFLVQDNTALEQKLLEREQTLMANVQAHKIVMENRRWYASKILRRQYGDDPAQVNTAVAVSVTPEQLNELRQRLGDARKLIERGNVESPLPVP